MIKVVKIGGNVVDNPELLREFVKDFAAMPGMKVLVHGGGVLASQMQKSKRLQDIIYRICKIRVADRPLLFYIFTW